MNVIVGNRYDSMLANLEIDIIKKLQPAEYDVEEIIEGFKNFFYHKMILDITAIKDYTNLEVMQKLSVGMDMDKVILLLDESPIVNSDYFISQLISMGIYNFTRNIDTIPYLIDNPNSYKDVAQYHNLNSLPISGNEPITAPVYVNQEITVGARVIGIKNVTEHAGATTLTYLMKKQLEKAYNVMALEVGKNDFSYLNDHDLKSTTPETLSQSLLMYRNYEVILVDLNKDGEERICTDVIYLIEPGLLKLNKLIKRDRNAFNKLKDKKIILNRSILNDRDIADFEYESKSRIFFNLPNLDDKRTKHPDLETLLIKLGFNKLSSGDKKGGIFNVFK